MKILRTIILSLISVSAAVAQTDNGITKRVELTRNKPCVILKGAVQPKNFDTYVFHAAKNQIIIAEPHYFGREAKRRAEEEGGSGFIFVAPGGKRSEDPQDVYFKATRTGDYKVLIRPLYRRTSDRYVLKISVTDKEPPLSDNFPNPPTCPSVN